MVRRRAKKRATRKFARKTKVRPGTPTPRPKRKPRPRSTITGPMFTEMSEDDETQ